MLWFFVLACTAALGITLEKIMPGLWMLLYASLFAVLYLVGGYLPETIAPEAETLYRKANRRGVSEKTGQETWLQVRVLHHLAVAEELYIHGLPIREAMLREKRAE